VGPGGEKSVGDNRQHKIERIEASSARRSPRRSKGWESMRRVSTCLKEGLGTQPRNRPTVSREKYIGTSKKRVALQTSKDIGRGKLRTPFNKSVERGGLGGH